MVKGGGAVAVVTIVVLVGSRRSLLYPHIPGGFQVEWMPIPCGFHPFHMESVWLRAQPFRRKFPCLFHMEIQWNLNIPWNIALESRWNPPQFNPWIPHYATWIPYISTWIPYIPYGFHIIPHGFHIMPYGFHIIPHGLGSFFLHILFQICNFAVPIIHQ